MTNLSEMSEFMLFFDRVEVCFVSMPISDISMPSMALSLMKSFLAEAGISSVIDYEHLQYAHRRGVHLYHIVLRDICQAASMIDSRIHDKAKHA